MAPNIVSVRVGARSMWKALRAVFYELAKIKISAFGQKCVENSQKESLKFETHLKFTV
jgi:hypothetical protein